MEGYLPATHAAAWWAAASLPLALGLKQLRRRLKEHPEQRLLLAASGGFAFLLSSLKLPSLTGSSSHPTGIALGVILFGPSAMTVMAFIVLLFQALLLAHGGLSTLGANLVSMGIVGGWVAWLLWYGGRKLSLPSPWVLFLAAFLGDLSTYLLTAFQLALAFPDPMSGVGGAWLKFCGVFALTQIPLAIGEGLLTVMVFKLLSAQASDLLHPLASTSSQWKEERSK